MSAQKSTKEVKELIDLVLAGLEVGAQAQKDGKIGLEDLGLMIVLLPKIGPAFQGVGEIPGELADLSTEEASDLVAHVMLKLSIGDVKAKEIITAALKFGVAGLQLYKSIKA